MSMGIWRWRCVLVVVVVVVVDFDGDGVVEVDATVDANNGQDIADTSPSARVALRPRVREEHARVVTRPSGARMTEAP